MKQFEWYINYSIIFKPNFFLDFLTFKNKTNSKFQKKDAFIYLAKNLF